MSIDASDWYILNVIHFTLLYNIAGIRVTFQ